MGDCGRRTALSVRPSAIPRRCWTTRVRGGLHLAGLCPVGKEARLLIRAIGRYLQPMLVPFGQNLYVTDGPTVSFFGFPYPTRMAVARLSTGNAWVWSPIRLTNELADAVETVGPVSYIVSPNKLHHLALEEWKNRWPGARLYAPPGLARKKKELHFDAELDDEPDSAWKADIDQTVFRGSFAMEEVVFFHRASRTVIFGDLIQRFPQATTTGWTGMLMRFDDLVGPHGSTPREWRLSFLSRKAARAARRKVLAWRPTQLLIAHGECAACGATDIVAASLSWI
jgi:hypothetical protein